MRLIDWLSNTMLKAAWNTAFRRGYSPQTLRRNFSILAAAVPWKYFGGSSKAQVDRVKLGGVTADVIATTAAPRNVMLYLHGGGYFMGTIEGYRHDATSMARECDATVAIIDYRLAPENPHPAALDDALAAYQALVAQHGAGKIIVAGDSAGGGLTLALLLKLRDLGAPLPARAICISPWTDLLGTGESVARNERRDAWLSSKHFKEWAPWYAGSNDPRHPYLSPVYGDPRGLPPLLLFAGDQEVLLDDSVRFAEKARAAEVDTTLIVGKNMQHDWMFGAPWLAESKKAWDEIRRFTHAGALPDQKS